MKESLKLLNFKDADPKFIEVILDQVKNQGMSLTYKLRQKDVDQNLFSPKEFKSLEKGKELWKKTCFECFFFDESSEQYLELNVSLDGKYDLISFETYRKQNSIEAPIKVSNLSVKKDQDFVYVSFVLVTNFTKPHFIAPSVILDGPNEQFFFALKHNDIKPDFHKKPNALGK
ncbi:MAG: hypothetical protein WCK43_05580 [bacterium]